MIVIRLEMTTETSCQQCGKTKASDTRYAHMWLLIDGVTTLLCFRCAHAEKERWVQTLDDDNNEVG